MDEKLYVLFREIYPGPFTSFIQDERAKRERDRIKWNTLMEEITKHKSKVGIFANT